ncbi:hypothetical protein F4677DRAFT_437509 [Hypoxylon crocopeplum]|nr:hypothetical protein F4677DRAFT_437509 [Hypoxylon crocopeplum]
MPPKRAKREYRGNACHRCHQQKVKCSREKPCRSCALAKRPCTYAVRDRQVTVPESYLKSLEGALAGPEPSDGARKRPYLDSSYVPQEGLVRDTDLTIARRPLDPLVENSTVEFFVSKLKQIQKLTPAPGTLGTQPESSASPDDEANRESTQSQTYEYFALNSDTSHAKCTFKLPPYPYAIYLFDQFSIYVGHDWHWFRLRRFRRRLDNIYMTIDSAESKDRIWLSQLLMVFALSSCVHGQERRIKLGPDGQSSQCFEYDTTPGSSPPPGMDFFEQALGLLKVPYEDVSVEHIETLNLVALCSLFLNRQKTAYIYAGLNAKMCNMLQLHKASSSLDCSPVVREHRKRVWWSTFCIDRMASTQLGLLPSLQIEQVDLEYPTQTGLLPDDLEEFSDPDYLTARVQLTIIQADAANNVCHLGQDDAEDIDTILRPVLRRLDAWREGLPAHMALGLQDSLPELLGQMPLMRSLANLHIRFNQCVIVLLRPLLLRQIACILSKEESSASQNDLVDMNDTCLRSARSNLRILIDVRKRGLLARLGYMENMHLFSSLMVLCLAMSINARRPHSFQQLPDDAATYEAGKDVLRDMIQAGSLAARGHEKSLNDVEALGRCIATDRATGGDLMAEQWDVDEWMTQLLEGENISDIF